MDVYNLDRRLSCTLKMLILTHIPVGAKSNISTTGYNQEYNVAIYIRLSKEDGDKEECESVINQRKILKAYAKENKYKIYDEYIDDGYTGTNFNRPSFKRMLKDIEDKKIKMVITKSLSSLGRDYIESYDDVQASIVQRIFNMYLEGYGPYHIARLLTEENIEPPGLQMEMTSVLNNNTDTTDKWNHNTVRRMLSNQVYIGNCVQNKQKKISYKSKKMINIPIEQQTLTYAHHEHIISVEMWDAVQNS